MSLEAWGDEGDIGMEGYVTEERAEEMVREATEELKNRNADLELANKLLSKQLQEHSDLVNNRFSCKARSAETASGNDPQDCNWPRCGCDAYANRVIEALNESEAA